ncbi:DUF2218 domain-containing protein [Pseudorhodobacter sp. W20_MBD10_FR17]|uniref:DUF2218 domain-containing protein n=1 Tax=Pseudorhodobacter sp. W20_MBD10_FR17 TaxID=3240266 RepID=UPI003F953BDE
MFTSTAKITTERASIYMQQLCKHFSHKVQVQFTPQLGHIDFAFGQCDLTASGADLGLTVTAETQADLTKTARVMASHLERFAFRENPQITWA